MGNTNNISLTALFQAFKRVIAPTPLAELPLIRHTPMPGNGELQWWDDRRYLDELRAEIFDAADEGGFVWEMPPPVLSETVLAGLKSDLDAAFWRFAHIFEDAA